MRRGIRVNSKEELVGRIHKYFAEINFEMERIMISYKPFYETLLKKNITEYHLIFKEGISSNTLHRMKKGMAVTTKTLDTLCFVLDCEVSDIIEHDKSK